MKTIDFLTSSINYARTCTNGEKALSLLSRYFYLGGSRAIIYTGKVVELQKGNISWQKIALKVSSYICLAPFTLPLFIVSLGLRAKYFTHLTLQSTQTTTLKQPKGETASSSPASAPTQHSAVPQHTLRIIPAIAEKPKQAAAKPTTTQTRPSPITLTTAITSSQTSSPTPQPAVTPITLSSTLASAEVLLSTVITAPPIEEAPQQQAEKTNPQATMPIVSPFPQATEIPKPLLPVAITAQAVQQVSPVVLAPTLSLEPDRRVNADNQARRGTRVVIDHLTIPGNNFSISEGTYKSDAQGNVLIESNGGDVNFQGTVNGTGFTMREKPGKNRGANMTITRSKINCTGEFRMGNDTST